MRINQFAVINCEMHSDYYNSEAHPCQNEFNLSDNDGNLKEISKVSTH